MFKVVEELLQRFDELQLACAQVTSAIQNDGRRPLYLTSFDGQSGLDRAIAIHSITQLQYTDSNQIFPASGLLCASAKVVDSIHALNLAKDVFKASVQALRAESSSEKTRIEILIARLVAQDVHRDALLSQALHRANLHRIDLKRCYAHIRVLPKNLSSVSWSWVKTHSAIVQVSLNEALAMAQALKNPITQKQTLEKLSNLPFNSKLAYKKKLPNQLRANIVWLENNQRLRKPVTVSGILIVQDEQLPQYVWRQNPDMLDPSMNSARLLRSDAEIEVEPYIEVLHLHRYVGKSRKVQITAELNAFTELNETHDLLI